MSVCVRASCCCCCQWLMLIIWLVPAVVHLPLKYIFLDKKKIRNLNNFERSERERDREMEKKGNVTSVTVLKALQ